MNTATCIKSAMLQTSIVFIVLQFCIFSSAIADPFAKIFGGVIVDPLAHFLATYERDPGDKIYRLKCDLEGNGGEAIFLAYSHDIAKDGDCMWSLYLKRGNAYIHPAGIDSAGQTNYGIGTTFNVNRYVIGNIPELKKWGLLTSEISTGRTGGTQLLAITITGDTVNEVKVGSFQPYVPPTPTPPPSPGASPAPTPTPTPSRFPNPPTPAIEILNP